MFLKLNELTEKRAAEVWKEEQQRLHDVLLNPENKLARTKPALWYGRLSDCELDLALFEYQFDQQNKTTILNFMRQSLEHLIQSYDLSEDKSVGYVKRSCLLALTGCFGTPEQRAHVGAYPLEAHTHHDVVDQQDQKLMNAYIDCLNQIQRSFLGLPMDLGAIQGSLDLFMRNRSVAHIQNFYLTEAQALIAWGQRNSQAWEAAITDHVAGHRRTALQGHLKRLNEGLIDLPALMLVKFGMDSGLPCRVDSPYLPLHLIRP